MRPRSATTRMLFIAVVIALGVASCASDDASAPVESTVTTAVADALVVTADAPFPAERCAANREAGTITFLTGFDFAAAASIVEVIYADALGFYEELCLDVEIAPSFSTANYPLVAGGQGQFASGGSFSEVVAFSEANDIDLVAVTIAGSTPIDSLILKPGVLPADADLTDPATVVAALAGTTIGVKGKLPPSLEVLLLEAGLMNGTDYQTVPVEGFDPVAHMALDGIVGVPGWKSNEPGRLEREGIAFDLVDPTLADIPGSFGVIFTTRQFIEAHPTAAEDFVRATLRGLEAAIADPEAAAGTAVELILANDNPNFLSPEGEIFRWATEADLISGRTPAGVAPGTPDVAAALAEVAAYQSIGLFGADESPVADRRLEPRLAAGVTGSSGSVVWPG